MSIPTNLNIINQNPLNQYSKFEPDLEEYQNKILKRNEVIALTEKIKKIKEETKIKRNSDRESKIPLIEGLFV